MSTLCKTCKGYGQTKDTRTVVLQVEPRVWKTKHKGSGCPDCLGLGIIGKRTVYAPPIYDYETVKRLATKRTTQ